MNPKVVAFLKRFIPVFFGLFFLAAHTWVPWLRRIHGYLKVDSMIWLGVTFLSAGLLSWIMPNGTLKIIEKIGASLQKYFGVIAISSLLLTLIGLYMVNQYILNAFLSSADEHSCYFLAECLRRGKLFVVPHPLSEFFNVVHVGNRGGKWFSVYPLGWPLIWSVGLRWGISDWLNPLLSTASVFFFYKSAKKLFGKAVAWLGLSIMVLSPFFTFTSASYFSHSTCLFMISLFLYAFLRWQEATAERGAVLWASLCAFAAGYGLMTRYLTMAAVIMPFFLYRYLPMLFEWRGRKEIAFLNIKLPIPIIAIKRPKFHLSDWLVIGILVVFMVAIFGHNYLVTGKLLYAPNRYDKSWERLGFNKHRYLPLDGLRFFIGRFFYLADWFPAAFIVFFLISFFQRCGFTALQQIYRFGLFYIAFAYFFYYSWGGNQFGPRYYYEAIPFLCIPCADYLVRFWRTGGVFRKKFLIGVMLFSMATTGYLFYKQGNWVGESSTQRKALYQLAERTLLEPSIVFIRGDLGNRLPITQGDAVRNSPFLDGRILYAHDLEDKNMQLMTFYPNREYYRGWYDQTLNQPHLERIFR